MKKPNGFGTVYKMSGRRRRPFRAVVSVGYDKDGKRMRRTLGYYETKKEAMTALGIYNAAPFSLDRLTFADIYDRWSSEHFPEIKSTAIYTCSYDHSRALHNRVFKELRTLDLENCIKAENTSPSIQRGMKLLYNALYKYALRYDLALRNYAAEVKTDRIPETEKRRPFSPAEIEILWQKLEAYKGHFLERTVVFILIGIYSGWRPAELCSYELDGDLMRGGVKTESGRERVVPVHPRISGLVGTEKLNLETYQKNFKKLMLRLGWEHTPHDTRRTFATLAAEAGMNEHVRKLIMGHKNPDLTERVYTQRGIDELRREIAKIG